MGIDADAHDGGTDPATGIGRMELRRGMARLWREEGARLARLLKRLREELDHG